MRISDGHWQPVRGLKRPVVLAGLVLSGPLTMGAPPMSAHSFFAFGFGFPIYAGPPAVYGLPVFGSVYIAGRFR